jgi:cytochrome P450
MAIFGAVTRVAPWLLPAIDLIMPQRMKEEVEGHARNTIQSVDKRLSTPSHKPDFISYILRETKAGPSSMLENREIYATTAAIIIAGSETSATTLAGAVYLLLRHPDKLTKLMKEIRDGFDSETDITPQSVAKKQYLQAVLDETQRLYPAVPKHNERVVSAGGCMIDGKFIPPGILVGVTPYAAYHSERNFKDAKSFVPERWLGDEIYANDDREVYWPFGYGPMSCIGVNMAHMELRTILSRLIWNFDMELLPETGDWMDQTSFIVWHRHPLMVRLTKRL